jgi:predicted enzyme related to lactoylglutathione lyase
MPRGRMMWFELPADDPKRAIAFYEKVFGWTIVKWEGPFDYWQIITGPDDEPGINGAIFSRRRMAERVTTDTIAVESVDDSLEQIVAAGGSVSRPKQAVPGIGFIAYCTDTEGNLFGIIQPDMSVR